MGIGEQLRKARTENGFSQNSIAEKIGVSRQTISNWETEKTYPDIESLIKLSELYQISLDHMLKDDEAIVQEWATEMDRTKASKRLKLAIILGAYLLIWGFCLILCWTILLSIGTMSFSYMQAVFLILTVNYIILPVSGGVLSALIAIEKTWGKGRYLALFFFSVMPALLYWLSFYSAMLQGNAAPPWMDKTILLPSLITSIIGFGIGHILGARE